jgi:hypothetical protein
MSGARAPSRREALAAVVASGLAHWTGCRPRPAATGVAPASAPYEDFHLDPLVDLVPAAGLAWVLVLRPHDLFARDVVARALEGALPDGQLELWATRLGGVDVRRASTLVLAGFAEAMLALARLPIDPAEVERAFASRVLVEGRAVDHGITRVFGTAGSERAQIALFGRSAVGLEHGRLGPLRASIYFAEGKLKRSLPALRTAPLSSLASRLGDAPVQGMAPGPFEGTWGRAAAGLLAGATAAGVSLRPEEGTAGEALLARVVLAGAWGTDAAAAAQRLEASFRVVAEDPLGRLLGLDRPVRAPRTRADPEFLDLEVVLDPLSLARGIRAATSASINEIIAP